jgi:hypothetical protein
MKKEYLAIGVIVIIILTMLIFLTNLVNPLDKSCNTDSDCVMANTELEQCGPCDAASPKLQCVSLKEAEELQNRRNLFLGRQQECMTCLTPKITYWCVCRQNICEKTAS